MADNFGISWSAWSQKEKYATSLIILQNEKQQQKTQEKQKKKQKKISNSFHFFY